MFLNSVYRLSKYIYIYIYCFQSLHLHPTESNLVLAMDIQHIYTNIKTLLIVCLILINREWHTVLSTAIEESLFFDVVRLQTTNQMLLCFHTQLSCNAHIHIHVIIWGNVYITCIQCKRLRPIHKTK